jgi:hypothetical protein
MAATEEPTTSHRRLVHLLPLSPRVPSSTDRHFEQYLIDHHHYSKLPSIGKQTINRPFTETKDYEALPPIEYGHLHHHNGSINRLLNSEQYRRAQARLIEYRQQSKIPGVALQPTKLTIAASNSNESILTGRSELTLPLKEIFIDPTRTKQQHQNQDELDLLVDDDSIFSDETDRRRRAKHWIKDHQFFFTEYQ